MGGLLDVTAVSCCPVLGVNRRESSQDFCWLFYVENQTSDCRVSSCDTEYEKQWFDVILKSQGWVRGDIYPGCAFLT